MTSIRRILVPILFALITILSIIGYVYSIHSSSNPEIPSLYLVQAVGGIFALLASIIEISYKDYTKDPNFEQKWRNFLMITTPLILVYIVAGTIIAIVLKSIALLLEIGLLYLVIMGALYVKVFRR